MILRLKKLYIYIYLLEKLKMKIINFKNAYLQFNWWWWWGWMTSDYWKQCWSAGAIIDESDIDFLVWRRRTCVCFVDCEGCFGGKFIE